jgi:hypothetical protein
MPSGATEQNTKLATFRHMVGIYNTKDLSTTYGHRIGMRIPNLSHNNLQCDSRAAPNPGIYNRVCHREAKAKRGFKLASLLINSCLGIQIVVAAALTAMGAADTNRSAITLFGAINTCIAGILTYLKGSGLPNRIRWYENEWKKVREYIEQRERDFARADCRLDVNQILQVVEAMYEEVKSDIQNNTPQMYTSASEVRARSATVQQKPYTPTLNTLMRNAENQVQTGSQKVEDEYGRRITEFLDGLAAKEEQRLKKLEMEIEETNLSALQKGLEMEEKGTMLYEKKLEDAKTEVFNKCEDLTEDTGNARAGVLQSEADLEKNIDDSTEKKMQAEHGLKREPGRKNEGVEVATQGGQSTGDSVQRTAKTVGDEPSAHK